MKTLSKNITPIFFKEENKINCYAEVKELWLELQKNKGENPLSLAHHILYAVLRGKNWGKCFTPITNKVKLENGAQEDKALIDALYYLNSRLSVFNDFSRLIDPESCAVIVRSLLNGKSALDTSYNLSMFEDDFLTSGVSHGV